MQSISIFLDIAKFAHFRRKNANVSRTQGKYHLFHIFFRSSFGKFMERKDQAVHSHISYFVNRCCNNQLQIPKKIQIK